jgi:hypothetical protein
MHPPAFGVLPLHLTPQNRHCFLEPLIAYWLLHWDYDHAVIPTAYHHHCDHFGVAEVLAIQKAYEVHWQDASQKGETCVMVFWLRSHLSRSIAIVVVLRARLRA